MDQARPDRPAGRGESLPRLGLILLALVTLGWGSAWPALKIVVTEWSPWMFRAVSVPGGGLVLMALILASRQSLAVPRSQWGSLIAVSLVNTGGWQMFSAFGLTHMASGRAALVAYTMPMWAALFSALILREPMRSRLIVALALGMAGVGTLLWGDREAVGSSPLGVAYMLAAAFSWGLGVVLMKRVHWRISTLSLAAWQLVIAGGVIIVAGALLGEIGLVPLTPFATGTLIFVIAIPIAFCSYAFFKVVSLFPASVSAIGTLMIPVVGVVSGALVLGEPIGWREIAAMALIGSALVLTLFRPARRS